MKTLPSADRIVKDIEFEILLGTIPQEDLANAVLSIKSRHNKLRSEVTETLRDPRLQEAFSKIFQAQEMLLVLLQEVCVILESLRAGLPEITSRAEHSTDLDWGSDLLSLQETRSEEFSFHPSINLVEVTEQIKSEPLRFDPEVRAPKLPVIGTLIRSVKLALHHLVLFYVNRLGTRQGHVNKVYGEQILRLYQVVLDQQKQVAILAKLIDDLRAQIQP